MMKKYTDFKLIILLLLIVVFAVWSSCGGGDGNGNGNGNGNGPGPTSLRADAGGPYTVVCGNRRTLNEAQAFAEAGVASILWTPIGQNWTQLGATLTNITTLTPTFQAPRCQAVGRFVNFTVQLTITDNFGRQTADTATIRVTEDTYLP